MPAKTTPFVALLRGINVGGNNLLPMPKLRAVFEASGCENVRTYIQSGNVVFEASKSVAEDVPKQVQAAIESDFGFGVPVILRSDREWRAIIDENPFLAAPGVDSNTLHVAVLSRAPADDCELDAKRSPPDRFAMAASVVYLHLPNGVAKTKFTNAYLDRSLGVVSTVRNWRTVSELAKMVDAQKTSAAK